MVDAGYGVVWNRNIVRRVACDMAWHTESGCLSWTNKTEESFALRDVDGEPTRGDVGRWGESTKIIINFCQRDDADDEELLCCLGVYFLFEFVSHTHIHKGLVSHPLCNSE